MKGNSLECISVVDWHHADAGYRIRISRLMPIRIRIGINMVPLLVRTFSFFFYFTAMTLKKHYLILRLLRRLRQFTQIKTLRILPLVSHMLENPVFLHLVTVSHQCQRCHNFKYFGTAYRNFVEKDQLFHRTGITTDPDPAK